MIIYLLFIPGTLLVIVMGIQLVKLNNQNNTLYRFCQLRRDIMSYLRKNRHDISEEEYREIERILKPLNKTIHYFHELKVQIFNFSNFKEILNQITKSTKDVENKKFKFETVQKFQEEYSISYINAFAELIPFFKWRLSAHLLYLVASFLVLIGIDSLMLSYQWFKNKSVEYHIDNRFKLA